LFVFVFHFAAFFFYQQDNHLWHERDLNCLIDFKKRINWIDFKKHTINYNSVYITSIVQHNLMLERLGHPQKKLYPCSMPQCPPSPQQPLPCAYMDISDTGKHMRRLALAPLTWHVCSFSRCDGS
jgi:hypothetical protein